MLHLATIFVLSHYDHLSILSLADILFFSHLCKQLLKLYTCIFIHNANAYEVLSNIHDYFTFASHICSNLAELWISFFNAKLFF